jgi:hypothetical protein
MKEQIEKRLNELKANLEKLYQMEQQVIKSLEDLKGKIFAHRGAIDALTGIYTESAKPVTESSSSQGTSVAEVNS